VKTLLIFDLETTGLEPQTCRVIEAAGALWSLPHRTLTGSFSFIVQADENPAEAVNRIPVGALRDHGFAQDKTEARLAVWFGMADAIVAHNASFDSGFLSTHLRESKPWICTKHDVEWPRSRLGAGLRDLAADHDVGVVRAHRAGADVDILVRLFERVAELGHDVDAMIARALRPKVLVVADVPKPWTVSKEEADATKAALKSAGFQWEDAAKRWARRMPREDVAGLPFAVQEVAA
jgi:DNA polymerase III alpha subunit (gram-positive type)